MQDSTPATPVKISVIATTITTAKTTTMIPTPYAPKYIEILSKLAQTTSTQSDLIYSGKSCLSPQLDAGWQAEKYATRAMSYRLMMMGKDWENLAIKRLNAMADKMNTNGNAIVCQTAAKPASTVFFISNNSKTFLNIPTRYLSTQTSSLQVAKSP